MKKNLPGLMFVGRVGQRPKMDLSLVMSSVGLATWIDGRSVETLVFWLSAFSRRILLMRFITCSAFAVLGASFLNAAVADEAPQIDGVSEQKKNVMSIGEITSYFRNGKQILQKMVSDDPDLNMVFYICIEGKNVFTYKVGILGTEFQMNEHERLAVKTPFAIKLGGDKESRIERITVYTHDFRRTIDGYWLKKNAIVPWSTQELGQWRKQRGEASR